MDGSWPGCSVHGILQARILEWAVIPFSRGSSRPRDQAGHTVFNLCNLSMPAPVPVKAFPPCHVINSHSVFKTSLLRHLLHGEECLVPLHAPDPQQSWAERRKNSSTHQNMDTSFPNQETLTRHLYKPTHSEEMPQIGRASCRERVCLDV